MARSTSVAAALAFLFAGAALCRAEEQPAKPIGTWTRQAGDHDIKFEIKPDGMRCTLKQGGSSVDIDMDYGVSKDGVLFGRIRKVEKTGTDNGPEAGELFSFRIAVNKDTLTV